METELTLRHLIDGEWVTGSGPQLRSTNPANPEQVVAVCAQADVDLVEQAVAAADRAQESWDSLGLIARGSVLRRAAELLAERSEQIAELMTAEEGKTISESRGEVGATVETLHYHAAAGRFHTENVFASGNTSEVIRTIRRALGVVGVITPWNFPVMIPVWKIAPALLWGNSVVWKPASNTPASAAAIAAVFADAGVPAGVLNLVIGPGRIGSEIVNNETVAGVTFTGSVSVGKSIAADCVARGAKVQLELGGHNAGIVCDDADLEHAVPLLVGGAMGSTGQKCTATRRIIAVDSIHDRLVDALGRAVTDLKIGDGMDPNIEIGPLVSASAQQEVRDALDLARSQGAEVVAEATTPDGPGWYGTPTLLSGTPKLDICQEEVFGPISTVLRVGDLAEAITLANDTAFGLTASIFTDAPHNIDRFVHGVDAGLLKVNGPTTGSEIHAPFGGLKDSTFPGPREQHASSAADFFTTTRTAYIKASPARPT